MTSRRSLAAELAAVAVLMGALYHTLVRIPRSFLFGLWHVLPTWARCEATPPARLSATTLPAPALPSPPRWP